MWASPTLLVNLFPMREGRGRIVWKSEENRGVFDCYIPAYLFCPSLSLFIYFSLQRYFPLCSRRRSQTESCLIFVSCSPSCVTTFRMSRHFKRVNGDCPINKTRSTLHHLVEKKRKEKKGKEGQKRRGKNDTK